MNTTGFQADDRLRTAGAVIHHNHNDSARKKDVEVANHCIITENPDHVFATYCKFKNSALWYEVRYKLVKQ